MRTLGALAAASIVAVVPTGMVPLAAADLGVLSTVDDAACLAGLEAQLDLRCPVWVTLTSTAGLHTIPAAVVASPTSLRVFVVGTHGYWQDDTTDMLTLAYGAEDGAIGWSATYDGPAHGADVGTAAALSPDGSRLYVVGPGKAPRPQQEVTWWDMNIVSYDTRDGALLWAQRYVGPGTGVFGGADWPSSVTVSPDGGSVYVTGVSFAPGHGADGITLAFDTLTGQPLWNARLGGPSWENDEFVAATPHDLVLVAGEASGSSDYRGADIVAVAYQADTGVEQWRTTVDGPWGSGDFVHGLAVSPDGRAAVLAGDTDRGDWTFDFFTVAIDLPSGAVRWTSTYGGDGEDAPSDAQFSPRGDLVFLTGKSDTLRHLHLDDWPICAPVEVGDTDMLTLAYDVRDGSQRWVSHLDGPSPYDRGRALAVSPDGTRVYVTGASEDQTVPLLPNPWAPPAGQDGFCARTTDYQGDFLTAAIDAGDGQTLWTARYNGPRGGWDEPYDMSLTSDGSRLVVAGFVETDQLFDLSWGANAYDASR